MKKRAEILTVILAFSMLATACGANNLEPEVRNTLIGAKEKIESITEEEEKAPDFSGKWEAYSDESKVINIRSTGGNFYSVTAELTFDDNTSGKWEMTAVYYDSTTLLEYKDAKYTKTAGDSEEVIYTDGDGYFWIKNENTICWMSGRSEEDGIDGTVDYYK